MAKERLSKIQRTIILYCRNKYKTNKVISSRYISHDIAKILGKGNKYIEPSFMVSYSRSLRNLVKKGYIIPQLEISLFEYEDISFFVSHKPIFKLSDKSLNVN